ncbi:PNGase F N-terminal domain-containing protein [Flavobacterium sp. MAHUQ-51]|uniref:PNGase F N-terminal domain-containing protein n=1 Tax=Flavobacterium sp. GCM10022190 TaxID=3252639 RepID=UPI003612394D
MYKSIIVKIIVTSLLVVSFCDAQVAEKANLDGYKITYIKYSNGKKVENQDPILVFTNQKETLLSSENIQNKKNNYPFEETRINRADNSLIQLTYLKANHSIAMVDNNSILKQNIELVNETKIILGYLCKKAKTVVNSNSIELWYTTQLKVKGAPTVLGQNLGLVLEMVRNNNSVITASKIEVLKKGQSIFISNDFYTAPKMDALSYRDFLWKSRFKTIKVFEEELVRFSDEAKSNDSILKFAKGLILVRKIKFPEIKQGQKIFIDLQQNSNGDAYDRTGTAFIIPTDKSISFLDGLQKGVKQLPIYTNGNQSEYQGVVATDNYSPLLEMMRFFTPFGIKQYNYLELKDKKWHEVTPYRQEITDLGSYLSGKELWVGMTIGNYDNGGHKVSMNITIHPGENKSEGSLVLKENNVLPLFNTVNVLEMEGQNYGSMFNTEKGLEVSFILDKDVKSAQLKYITTGHGGWENGDEFVPKKNTILLDGKAIFSFIPWRQDCGSYRLFNPSSGNFSDGLSSSDLSRSNWCPGTVTTPIYIDLGDLKAGKHTIQVQIPMGKPEGGSFSAWNVSGCLVWK